MSKFRSATHLYSFEGDDLVVSRQAREETRTPAVFNTLDRTRQEFRLETDPNTIMRRFAATGELGRLNPKTGEYLDVSEVPDLLTAVEQAGAALDSFRALPDNIRAIVGDDPRKLVALSDHLSAVRAYKAANPPRDPKPATPAPASPAAPVAAPGAS